MSEIPQPPTDGAAPTPPETASAARTFVGLFLVPLLVVVICVGIFIGFGWIAYDQSSTRDYLNDLRSSWRPRRAQAAYELSKILVADPRAFDDEPGTQEELRRLFSESEEPEVRGYLALVLGRTGDSAAVPLLVEAIADADPQTRVYALWALGLIGDPSALPALVGALADSDPGLRKTAAYALGEVGDPAALAPLEAALDDRAADVRWNAALAVARLGSAASAPELERMLDRRLTGAVEGISAEQQQEAMIGAIRALAAVRGEAALPLLAALEAEDPSLKVRQAAIEARKAIRSDG